MYLLLSSRYLWFYVHIEHLQYTYKSRYMDMYIRRTSTSSIILYIIFCALMGICRFFASFATAACGKAQRKLRGESIMLTTWKRNMNVFIRAKCVHVCMCVCLSAAGPGAGALQDQVRACNWQGSKSSSEDDTLNWTQTRTQHPGIVNEIVQVH